MNLDPVLLEILVCPACKASLTVDQDHDELVCNGCGLIYPVRDDIPIMLIDEARRPEPAPTEPPSSSHSPDSVGDDAAAPGAASGDASGKSSATGGRTAADAGSGTDAG